MNFLDNIIGILAPHICLGCGQEGTLLCSICIDYFPPLLEQVELRGLGPIRAAIIYEGIAKDLVWQLKFRGARSAVNIMARTMAPLLPTTKEVIIVPVPTAARRVRQRGFDQAKLLAKRISRYTGMEYMDCLRRHGNTHQVGSSRQQRLLQLKNAYSIKENLVLRNRAVVLVDDILTTGATLEAAATTMKKAGIARIDGVVFAQVDQLLG